MLGTLALRSPSPASPLPDIGVSDLFRLSRLVSPPPPSRFGGFCCTALRDYSSIPKLKPFSRSRIERLMGDPPLLHKVKTDITDYCLTLEGDECYSCWQAYFKLVDLEKEMPKEDLEKIVRQCYGVKSLIGTMHRMAAADEHYKKKTEKPKVLNPEPQKERPFPVPDGLPKTKEELEEEEKARMPDSDFTRLLRRMGKSPAWYTHAPDHETD